MLSKVPAESTNFSVDAFHSLRKKGNPEREQNKYIKYQNYFNAPDHSNLLTIINPDESERPYFNLRSILVSLHNNQYLLNPEESQNRRSYAIKPFMASSNERLQQNDKIRKLKAIVDQKWSNELTKCIPLIHQFFEVIKLQYDQICTNVLMFKTIQEGFDNTLLKSLYFHQKYQREYYKRPSQRILVINLHGMEGYNDYAAVDDIRKENCQILHLSLLEKIKKNNCQYYQHCYIRGREKINWQQFKTVYKIQMKNMIDKFNPQLSILQLGIDFNNVKNSSFLSFEEDCLERIIRKFSKISRNKLIVLLTIKEQSETVASAIDPDQRVVDQKIEQIKLKGMINCLSQGILRSKTTNYKKTSNYEYQQWLQETITDLKQLQTDSQIITQYHRLLSNISVTLPTSIKEEKLPFNQYEYFEQEQIQEGYFQLINPNIAKQIIVAKLIWNNQFIKIYPDTEVHFRYEENLIAILQPREYALYYTQIDYSKKVQQCYKFEIEQTSISDCSKTNPTVAILKGIIYLLYGFLGDKILSCDTKTHQILEMSRTSSDSINSTFQQNICQREGARVFYNFVKKGEAFVVVGGELLNDTPLICNVFESIYLQSASFFASRFIKKEELFKQQSHKPWQNQIILENENCCIFLPGNYDNHKQKYCQVINSDHYKQAQMLTFDKNGKIVWTNLEIQYKNTSKWTPNITVLSSNQRNVCYLNHCTWKVAVSGWEEENFGDPVLEQVEYLSDISKKDTQTSDMQYEILKQHTQSYRYVLHSATINLQENLLIVQIDSYQIGGRKVILRKAIEPKNGI